MAAEARRGRGGGGGSADPRQGPLSGGAPSLTRAGHLLHCRPSSFPRGFFRRGGGRAGREVLPACSSSPHEPSVARLEELVRKLQVTEEKRGDTHRQPCRADSAPQGPGEPRGDRRGVPMDLEAPKPQDCAGGVSWASPRTQGKVDNSIRGEWQAKPFPKSMVLKLQSWDRYLEHAGQCRGDICLRPSCKDIKQLVRHIQACGYSSLVGCHLCNQLVALCYVHALHCTENPCSAPFCLAIKPLLQKMPIWLLPAKVKHGKMVGTGTARSPRVSGSAGDPYVVWQAALNAPRPSCVNGPVMPSQQPGQPPFRMPVQQMGCGLRLPSMELLPCDIPWSVMAFLRRTMKSFKFPEEKGQEISAHGKPAFETGLQPQTGLQNPLAGSAATTAMGLAPSTHLAGEHMLPQGPCV